MEFADQINIAQSVYSIEIYGNININSNSTYMYCISLYMVIHV